MATQFTSASLARLLRNVDRQVLKDAIDLADLWDVFSSFERETLIELGGAFNYIANLNMFGEKVLGESHTKFFRELRGIMQREIENPIARFFVQSLFWMLTVVFDVKAMRSEIEIEGVDVTQFDIDELREIIENYEIIMVILRNLTEEIHAFIRPLDEIVWTRICDPGSVVSLNDIAFSIHRVHQVSDVMWGRVRQAGEGSLPQPEEGG